jgi:hypothetical protein
MFAKEEHFTISWQNVLGKWVKFWDGPCTWERAEKLALTLKKYVKGEVKIERG